MFQIFRNGLFVEIEHLANQGKVGSHLPWQNAWNSLVCSSQLSRCLHCSGSDQHFRSAWPCPLSLWTQTQAPCLRSSLPGQHSVHNGTMDCLSPCLRASTLSTLSSFTARRSHSELFLHGGRGVANVPERPVGWFALAF